MGHLTLLIALAAVAQGPQADTGGASANPVDQIKACRAITDPSARLSCYDRASSALDTAIAQRDITVLDKQEVRKTRRSLFGFSLPNLKLLGMGDKDEEKAPEFTQLDTKVTSFRGVSYEKYDIETTEGAIWRNTDSLEDPPIVGDAVHLKRGAIGSYFMKVGSSRAVRAMRVR